MAPIAVGAAAGLIGGLFASWLMVGFQKRIWPAPTGDGGESSSAKLARQLAERGGAGPLTDDQARRAGEAIHYALGAALGAVYGATASVRPEVARAAGLPFGMATEIVFDQTLVPALGLGNPFWKCPIEWHLRGLAAHLLFGVVTDMSRRLMISRVAATAPERSRYRPTRVRTLE